MRGRLRRLVTRSLVRVGSSQPLLFLASSVLGALLAVLVRAYEVVRSFELHFFTNTCKSTVCSPEPCQLLDFEKIPRRRLMTFQMRATTRHTTGATSAGSIVRGLPGWPQILTWQDIRIGALDIQKTSSILIQKPIFSSMRSRFSAWCSPPMQG